MFTSFGVSRFVLISFLGNAEPSGLISKLNGSRFLWKAHCILDIWLRQNSSGWRLFGNGRQ